MSKVWVIVVSVLLLFSLGFITKKKTYKIDYDQSIREVLEVLDSDIEYAHEVNTSIQKASLEKGKDIVTKGYTRKNNGFKTKRISKHFVCTSCHNLEREDPDLAVIDPQARLEFTNAVEIPFLQGSPLYGIVNRNSFYNGDYYKKYGDLVNAARNDLRQSIQLCSTECSQGRLMKDWELESVIMYLWSLELKMNDLEINGEEEQIIARAMDDGKAREEAVEIIEGKYLKSSPAHFIDPPSSREERKNIAGNAENGMVIYENSCLHCHQNRRYSFFNLDNNKTTFRNLKNNLGKYHERSIYQVARYGTKPNAGKKAYMPQYTREKMSTQQLEDLKAYIAREAE